MNQSADDGPTPKTIAHMADLVRQFLAKGGTIRHPPHQPADRGRWQMQALQYLSDFEALPAAKQTERLKKGLLFMWGALFDVNCIVAQVGIEVAAAISYQVMPDHIRTKEIGSRQATETRGAGNALEFALAYQAAMRGFGVKGTYDNDARGFHEGIGRRLDRSGVRSTEWTAADCDLILGTVEEQT